MVLFYAASQVLAPPLSRGKAGWLELINTRERICTGAWGWRWCGAPPGNGPACACPPSGVPELHGWSSLVAPGAGSEDFFQAGMLTCQVRG